MGFLTFLGACGTVTGSCYLLEAAGKSLLIDCGLYQGEEAKHFPATFAFDPKEIDYVILTHVHLDHSGRLIELVRDGFRGEILTTQATIDLLEIVLRDRLHLEPHLAPENIVQKVIDLCWAFEYGKKFEITPDLSFRLQEAGHILGSAHIELWAEGKKFVFSGDIGRQGTPIIRDPTPIKEADFVIIESTYGGRLHPPLGLAKKQLKHVIELAQRERARIYIPSFAIGRTQELLYLLNDLIESKSLKPLPVILDSPMALQVTRVYAKHTELYDEEALRRLEAGDQIFSFPLLFSAASIEASRKIEHLRPPFLVIAGSGMVTGGRIIDHLKRHLPEKHTFVVFVGYQARGTPGREILEHQPKVKLNNEWISNQARIFRLEAFSAHADHRELLSWLKNFDHTPRRVFITHGERKARQALELAIQKELGLRTERPKQGRRFNF